MNPSTDSFPYIQFSFKTHYIVRSVICINKVCELIEKGRYSETSIALDQDGNRVSPYHSSAYRKDLSNLFVEAAEGIFDDAFYSLYYEIISKRMDGNMYGNMHRVAVGWDKQRVLDKLAEIRAELTGITKK